MELTKEEMKKVIAWLEDYYVSSYKPEDFPDDMFKSFFIKSFKNLIVNRVTHDSPPLR